MAQENNIAQQLNDLLVTRNFHPDMRDSQGKVCDSSDAKVFTFDYVSGSGKDYGTMVIILDSGNDLKAMFGNNLGRGMEDADKDEWYKFQQQLSQFANSHRYTYTGDDISKLKYTMQGLAAITEGLFEGYYGTRRISYAGEPTQARLMIRHNRNLGENDARFRYVESIFVETADGERYRLPFTNLAGGRAMLEHVRQGGKPYDVRGNHICEMITELKVLARFNRASQGRVVEGVKQSVVQGAQTYYKSLRESIKRLSSPRGYTAYFESWHPASITEQDQLVEDIKTLFVEQTIDDRIEQALPLLAKIQQGREMKEAEIFENWVNNVTEGTWSLPETPEQMTRLKELMSGELIVGPDGTNATEQLYDLIGDDVLFDRISELAAQDPDANVWDDTDVQDILRALGIQMPDDSAPDMNAQPQQGLAEGGMPSSVIKSKQRYGDMSDKDFAELHQSKADDDLVAMAWRHGYGKGSLHYVNKRKRGKEGVAEAAKWRDPKYQGKTFDYDDSYEGPHDTRPGRVSLDRAGMRQINTFDPLEYKAREKQATGKLTPQDVKYATAKNFGKEKQQQLDYDRSRKAEQGVAEADNIAAFESLQRMRHLSGMKLEEARIEESSEFMYEKIGKTLAQQQPMLDVNSDQFVHAVYDEMIELGMTPKSAKHKLSYDRDFLGDVANSFHHYVRHQPDGQTVGQVMSQVGTRGLSGRPAPLTECNSTMEGEYCPEHGLSECWSQGMYEDILSTGIQLAEDDKTNEGLRDEVAKRVMSKMDNLRAVSKYPDAGVQQAGTMTPSLAGKVVSDYEQPLFKSRGPSTPYTSDEQQTLQGVKKQMQSQADKQSNWDYAGPRGSRAAPSPQATRAAQSQGAAFDAQNNMQSNQDRIKNAYGIDEDEASISNPKIPIDFGSDDHLKDLLKLSGAYRAGDRSSLQKSTNDLLARMTGQDKSSAADVAPSFGTPGAAHAGQGGSDYQDEEPNQSDAETARLARSGTADMPNDRRMNDADYINSLNPDMPKGQAHDGQGGYDYGDDPDQSDAETSRLNRAGNSVDLGLPPGQLDKNAWDDMMKTVPALDKDAWNDLVRGNVSEADRADGFADPGFNSERWKSTRAGQAKPQLAPAKTPSFDVTKDPLFRAAMNRIDADNKGMKNPINKGFTADPNGYRSDEPLLSPLGKAPSLPSNRVTPVDATDTFESREGDALLARIKSLALIK